MAPNPRTEHSNNPPKNIQAPQTLSDSVQSLDSRHLQITQDSNYANKHQQTPTNRHCQTSSNSTWQCLRVSVDVCWCLLASIDDRWHFLLTGSVCGDVREHPSSVYGRVRCLGAFREVISAQFLCVGPVTLFNKDMKSNFFLHSTLLRHQNIQMSL